LTIVKAGKRHRVLDLEIIDRPVLGAIRVAPDDLTAILSAPQFAAAKKGWPLRKTVVAHELAAVASRVSGVSFVNDVLLAADTDTSTSPQIQLFGLQLPRIAGLSIVAGDHVTLDALRGQRASVVAGRNRVAVPVIPEDC
jgi:hypothetical protein